ncbi:hypothetical protein [Metabacillus idriensis]|uniref:hypothetical protein n=1 Tax=Metabacillus idriensis TaxID=324768 RepID=UPI003D2A0920
MLRSGNKIEITLKDVHLNWGTEGASRSARVRNPYESYIPISMEHAKRFNILKGETFECISDDGYFEGDMKATGSQGNLKQYGKNLVRSGNMRALGYWLKDRKNARPGDKVVIEFIEENKITISFCKNTI